MTNEFVSKILADANPNAPAIIIVRDPITGVDTICELEAAGKRETLVLDLIPGSHDVPPNTLVFLAQPISAGTIKELGNDDSQS
jgi:hypothetical protein